MRRFLAMILMAVAFGMVHPAWAVTCNNASLSGKYVLDGQGDTYNACILGFLCVGHNTLSTTGYIVADGIGNITSARLFEATNSGVQDSGIVQSAGTYSVTDCDNGTLHLTVSGQSMTFSIDVNDVDVNGLAHSVAALDGDAGYDEALRMVRTVDPTGAFACSTGTTLNGLQSNGIERGHDTSGNPLSSLTYLNFSGGSITGGEKVGTPTGFTTSAISGTYTMNADCSVVMTRTVNGVTTAGAHIVSGGDSGAPERHSFAWQGDYMSDMGAGRAGGGGGPSW
ncbi:hypothetical protein ACQUJS_04295 [Ralstonia pseudosolanacearum]|uniref:Uncharacterized protein n=1 Tax=Ralstonia solanacearum TaxID=305 RepID=A0A0S4TNE9_RALSL|nr:exported protein of unknown function [Ralstonia solanacearum]